LSLAKALSDSSDFFTRAVLATGAFLTGAFFTRAFFAATLLEAFLTAAFFMLVLCLAADSVFFFSGVLPFFAVEVACADPFLTAITFSFINVNHISSLLYCD
jgi:hypothetical protein